jgi:uncharacterized repeat protein (TIGR01451 family)
MGGALRVFGLELDTYGTVSLQLERFSVFAPDATIEVVDGPSVSAPTDAYFQGLAADDPDSIVMLAVPENGRGGKIRGVITMPSGAWLLEGTPGQAGLRTRKVDLENELAGRTFECGVDKLPFNATNLLTAPNEASSAEAAGIPVVVQYTAHMIVDTDYEYWLQFWNLPGNTGNPERTATEALTYLGDLFAYASIPYEREVRTNLLIIYARLFATNSDPYSHNGPGEACGCDAYGKLNEVKDAWSGNNTPRTLVHFVSGKSEGCGCSYTGDYNSVLCSQSDGYAASSHIGTGFNIDDPAFMWESYVIAHETGHNFGSRHTHQYCDVPSTDFPEPVDRCFDGCDGAALGLPGLDSLTGGVTADHPGTIMSYCHQLTGGQANIMRTFGQYHPYGKAPWRVPSWMLSRVLANTACMGLDYTGADLRVYKDCKPDEPMLVGDTATCTITIENLGPNTAQGVVALDEYLSNGIFSFGAIAVTKGTTPMPEGTCTTTGNPQDQSGTVTCDLGLIDSGHTVTIMIPVTANGPQNINDRVSVSGDTSDPDITNNVAEDTVIVIDTADIMVSKDCKPDSFVLAGDTATCTIWVDNLGPSTANNVELKDAFVANGGFQFGTVTTTAGTCTPTPNPQVNSGNVNCSLGNIVSGGRVTIVVPVSAVEDMDINNVATVSRWQQYPAIIRIRTRTTTKLQTTLP